MDDLISRREAIKVVRASCHWDYPWASKSPNDIMSDAVNALKGLPSAQPEIKTDGDTISRRAALDALEWKYAGKAAFDAIKALPSAQPEPKTGYWILSDTQSAEELRNDNYLYYCSECGKGDIHSKSTVVSFCWNCGAKMIKDGE